MGKKTAGIVGLGGWLEAGVYGFAFEGEDGEDAFVDATEGLAGDEAFEGFDPEGEFAHGEGLFAAEMTLAQPFEVFGGGVFGSVDEAQVFAAATFDGRLHPPFMSPDDEVEGFDDHTFAAPAGSLFPPGNGGGHTGFVVEVYEVVRGCQQEGGVGAAEGGEGFHVPDVGFVYVGRAFGG